MSGWRSARHSYAAAIAHTRLDRDTSASYPSVSGATILGAQRKRTMSTVVEESGFAGGGLDQIVLHLRPNIKLSDRQFFDICLDNPDVRIEANDQGALIIMAPLGCESGERESEIIAQLRNWAKKDGTGKTFSSSTIFHLPNGAYRSPASSWVRLKRWNKLTKAEQKKCSPICPDFVIELRSETDRLPPLKAKMEEYIDNSAEMGLLIDRIKRQVHVYRRGRKAKVLDEPETVSCEPTLPGFALDMEEVW
jgi:Uma2 family endonuclease